MDGDRHDFYDNHANSSVRLVHSQPQEGYFESFAGANGDAFAGPSSRPIYNLGRGQHQRFSSNPLPEPPRQSAHFNDPSRSFENLRSSRSRERISPDRRDDDLPALPNEGRRRPGLLRFLSRRSQRQVQQQRPEPQPQMRQQRGRRNVESLETLPDRWSFHHPARDDPNFPQFDHLNFPASALFDRDRNPVLAAKSRTPSIGSLAREMANLRREAGFDEEDRRRAVQGQEPMDRLAAVRKDQRKERELLRRGIGEFYWSETDHNGQNNPEMRYRAPPWAHETPPETPPRVPMPEPEVDPEPQRQQRGRLGRLLSFKGVAPPGRNREPLERDRHPLPERFVRPDYDYDHEGRRELIMEPYMDFQASVAGSRAGTPPASRSRDRLPYNAVLQRDELLPEERDSYYHSPPDPPPPQRQPTWVPPPHPSRIRNPLQNFSRDPRNNVRQTNPIFVEIPQPVTNEGSLIPPPPEPLDVTRDGMQEAIERRDRRRIPKPWNAFGGMRNFPRWGATALRRLGSHDDGGGAEEDQNLEPTPLRLNELELEREREQRRTPASQQRRTPSSQEPVPQIAVESPVPDGQRSPSSDETLTEHSPLPRSLRMQRSQQLQLHQQLERVAEQQAAGPSQIAPRAPAAAEPPTKPARSVHTLATPEPTPPPRQSALIPIKPISIPWERQQQAPDRQSGASSPGFDRSASTIDLPAPRWTPISSHVDKLIDVFHAVRELPWMAERVTVDYIPAERPRERKEDVAIEYLAPPPPDPISWYTYDEERKRVLKRGGMRQRLNVIMSARVKRNPAAAHTLYLSDTTESDRGAMSPLPDQRRGPRRREREREVPGNAGPGVNRLVTFPVHTSKGVVRRVIVPAQAELQGRAQGHGHTQEATSATQASSSMFPPTGSHVMNPSTMTSGMLSPGPGPRVAAPGSTPYVFPMFRPPSSARSGSRGLRSPAYVQPGIFKTPQPRKNMSNII